MPTSLPKHGEEEGLEGFRIIERELWVPCHLGSDVLVELDNCGVEDCVSIVELLQDVLPVLSKLRSSVRIRKTNGIAIAFIRCQPGSLRLNRFFSLNLIDRKSESSACENDLLIGNFGSSDRIKLGEVNILVKEDCFP